MSSKFLNISTDTTLGGSGASDETVSSQKAVKAYVDAHSGGGGGGSVYITETYSNGSDWYRIWSDGWCEQGGSATGSGSSGKTVDLLKTYTDTNYNVKAQIIDYTSGSQKIVSVGSKSTSSFKAFTSTTSSWGSYAFNWTACGYIN